MSISLIPTCRSAVAPATRRPCASACCSAPSYSRRALLGRPAASHMSASVTVLPSSSTTLSAACRLATAWVKVSSALGDIAVRPCGEPEDTRPHRPARDGRRGRPGPVPAWRVPPCPPYRLVLARARPGRWRWSPGGSGAPRYRPTGEPDRPVRRPARVPRRRVGPPSAARSPETISMMSVEEAEHRAAPDGVVGQRLQPAEQHGFLPVTSDRRRGQLDQVRRTVEVAAGQGVPDRLLREVVALVPQAGALVQERNQVRSSGEQVRPQHVGEQVVVAVPLPPIVQGHENRLARSRVMSSWLPSSRPVTASQSGPVSRSRTAVCNRNSRIGSG